MKKIIALVVAMFALSAMAADVKPVNKSTNPAVVQVAPATEQAKAGIKAPAKKVKKAKKVKAVTPAKSKTVVVAPAAK